MTRYNDTSKAKSKQAMSVQNRKAALDAAAHGIEVFPVRVTRNPKKPNKKKVKVLVSSWMSEATTDQQKINEWWDKYPDAVPGMKTGDFLVVDIDVDDTKDGFAEYEAMGLSAEDALFVAGTPSGGAHLYYENPERFSISQNEIAPGLDTRGYGGFVIAPGAVTVFGEYKIKWGALTDLEFGCLTPVPEPVAKALKKEAGDEPRPEPAKYDLETIRDALTHVANDGDYGDWTETIMAVHHATGGSEEGLALVLGWSVGCDGFTKKEVETKWRSLGKR